MSTFHTIDLNYQNDFSDCLNILKHVLTTLEVKTDKQQVFIAEVIDSLSGIISNKDIV